jgi:[ribosomal protein S18]-alanine N-acetyltransferase
MIPARIRVARPGDLPRLAELESESFPAPWPEEDLARVLAGPAGLALVAETGDGHLAGYALFLRVLDEAELLRMGVEARARRQGIGRALVAAGLERLEEVGVGRVQLEVRPSNRAAWQLYEALGFRLAGRRPGYYADGEEALIYQRKALPPA